MLKKSCTTVNHKQAASKVPTTADPRRVHTPGGHNPPPMNPPVKPTTKHPETRGNDSSWCTARKRKKRSAAQAGSQPVNVWARLTDPPFPSHNQFRTGLPCPNPFSPHPCRPSFSYLPGWVGWPRYRHEAAPEQGRNDTPEKEKQEHLLRSQAGRQSSKPEESAASPSLLLSFLCLLASILLPTPLSPLFQAKGGLSRKWNWIIVSHVRPPLPFGPWRGRLNSQSSPLFFSSFFRFSLEFSKIIDRFLWGDTKKGAIHCKLAFLWLAISPQAVWRETKRLSVVISLTFSSMQTVLPPPFVPLYIAVNPLEIKWKPRGTILQA